jgi:hypothetical protein
VRRHPLPAERREQRALFLAVVASVREDAEEVEDLLGRMHVEDARPGGFLGDDPEAFEDVQDDLVLCAEDFGRVEDGSCGLHARLPGGAGARNGVHARSIDSLEALRAPQFARRICALLPREAAGKLALTERPFYRRGLDATRPATAT